MNFFKNIKIMWLRYRVYKYTLKSENYLSKSISSNKQIFISFNGFTCVELLAYFKLVQKCEFNSNRYFNLYRMYLGKQFEVEKQLMLYSFVR